MFEWKEVKVFKKKKNLKKNCVYMKGTAERKEHTYSEINFEKSVIYET